MRLDLFYRCVLWILRTRFCFVLSMCLMLLACSTYVTSNSSLKARVLATLKTCRCSLQEITEGISLRSAAWVHLDKKEWTASAAARELYNNTENAPVRATYWCHCVRVNVLNKSTALYTSVWFVRSQKRMKTQRYKLQVRLQRYKAYRSLYTLCSFVSYINCYKRAGIIAWNLNASHYTFLRRTFDDIVRSMKNILLINTKGRLRQGLAYHVTQQGDKTFTVHDYINPSTLPN